MPSSYFPTGLWQSSRLNPQPPTTKRHVSGSRAPSCHPSTILQGCRATNPCHVRGAQAPARCTRQPRGSTLRKLRGHRGRGAALPPVPLALPFVFLPICGLYRNRRNSTTCIPSKNATKQAPGPPSSRIAGSPHRYRKDLPQISQITPPNSTSPQCSTSPLPPCKPPTERLARARARFPRWPWCRMRPAPPPLPPPNHLPTHPYSLLKENPGPEAKPYGLEPEPRFLKRPPTNLEPNFTERQHKR